MQKNPISVQKEKSAVKRAVRCAAALAAAITVCFGAGLSDGSVKAAAEGTGLVAANPITPAVLDAAAASITDPISCGENATLTVVNNVLTVSGTGKMVDFASASAAAQSEWAQFNSLVTEIVIGEGITSVGDNCFNGFTAVGKVTIGSDVTEIGDGAFYGCSSIETVNMKTSVLQSIGDSAFRDCAAMKIALNLPSTVTYIGAESFYGCKSVTKLTVPGGVAGNFGAKAFYGCTDLASVTIGEGVTSIKDGTFTDCTNLTTLNLPVESLTEIGAGAFNACTSLAGINGNSSSLEIPANVTTIGDNAFNNCGSVTDLIISCDNLSVVGVKAFANCESLINVSITGGNDMTIGKEAFSYCKSLKAVTMDQSNITTLSEKAFKGSGITSISLSKKIATIGIEAFAQTPLTALELPASVTNVNRRAFYECSQLKSIRVDNTERTGTLVFDTESFAKCIALEDINMSGVTNIAANAFKDCTALKKVTIPATEAMMGSNAFTNCTALSEVIIEEGAKALGNSAFTGCSSLTSIEIPSSVTSMASAFQNNRYIEKAVIKCSKVGSGAFSGCTSLTSVTLENTESIDSTAFKDCAFTAVALPESLKTLGSNCFENCKNLAALKLPNSVTDIPAGMVKNCTALTDISFGDIASVGYDSFAKCSALKKITLPASLKSIGIKAFSECSVLENVIIPDGVISIGTNAFEKCVAFTSMTLPDSIIKIPNYIFDGCTSLAEVVISDEAITIGDYAFRDCKLLTGFTIPKTVTSIGSYSFANCAKLDSTIPADVSKLGDYSFSGCSSLGSTCTVEIPSGISTINRGVFKDCISLASPVLPEGISGIGDNAFAGCTSEKFVRIDIVGSAETIGRNAFDGCKNLETVYINADITTINDKAFNNCVKLKNVSFPSTLKTLGSYALAGCENITAVTLGSNLKSIGTYAFSGCKNLEKVSIAGTQIINVSQSLFENCSKIKNIELPPSVTRIDGSAFAGCSSLESITIPGMVTSLGAKAFMNCTALEYVIVPTSVTNFGTQTFSGCENLTSVIVLTSTAVPGSTNVFENCNSELVIYCYEGSKTADFAERNKLSYEIMTGSNGSYVVILKDPATTVCAKLGETVTLTVKAASEGEITYEWYYKNPGDSGFTKVANNNTASYTMTVTSETNGQEVYVRVTSKSAADASVTNTADSEVAQISVLKVTAVPGNEAAAISWNAIKGAEMYRLYVNNGSGWKTLAYPKTNSYTATGLTNGKVYSYRVMALINGKWSVASAAVNVTPSAAGAPVNLKATAGNKSAYVTWNKVAGATKYRFYQNDGSGWKTVAYPTTNSYTATGLTNGKTYSFRVLAYVGNSWSEASAIVKAAPKATAGPLNIKGSAGYTCANITWDPIEGADKYKLMYNTGTGWKTLAYPKTTNYTALNLINEKEYSFAVKAIFGSSTTYASKEIKVTPSASAGVVNLKLTAGNESAQLTWDEIPGATMYRLYQNTGSGWKTVAYPKTNSHLATGLTNGKTTSFRVTAYVRNKWTGASATVKAVPSAKAAPLGVKVTAGNKSALVTWAKIGSAEKYRLYMNTGSGWKTVAYPKTNSYTVSGLTNSKSVSFRVVAYIDGKATAASATVKTTPSAKAAPLNVKAKAGDKTVTVSWTKIEGATKYKVMKLNGTKWSAMGYSNTTSYKAENLSNNISYSFKVVAYVDGAWTDASASVKATPKA